MNNPQFSVSYNGHPVAITVIDADTYIAQVTYKPMHLQLKKNNDGTKKWIDVDSQQETYVTSELGKLITNHYHSLEHA